MGWFSWGHRAVEATAAAVKKLAAGVGSTVAGILPGAWSSDHRAEAEHFTGWSYIAIHALAMQASKAEVIAYVDDGVADAKHRRKALRNNFGSVTKFRQFRDTLAPPGTKSNYGADDRATTALPPDHRLVRLLKRPNPWESGATFRYKQVQQIRLTGTCLVWNVPGQDGLTAQRYVIPTAVATAVNPTTELPLGGYRISPAISRYAPIVDNGFVEMPLIYRSFGKVIDAREVQVIRLPHPWFLDDGQSPMAAGALWIDAAEQVDRARFSQLKNGANPSLIWSLGENTTADEDTLNRLAVKVNKKYGGTENHDKIMVVNGVDKVTPVTTTPKDMAYEKGWDQGKAASLALHNTPPVAVGLQEPGAFAAYYASMRAFKDNAVQPMLDMLAESDTETLAPQFGAGITIEAEAMTSEDADLEERKLANDLAAGIRTRDEIRALRGLPPLGPLRGGDDLVGTGAPPPPAEEVPKPPSLPTELTATNGVNGSNGKHRSRTLDAAIKGAQQGDVDWLIDLLAPRMSAKCGGEGGKPGPCPTGRAKPTGVARTVAAPVTPKTKSEIAKASATRVDATIQRYSEEGNEPKFAKTVGGSALKNNEPVDIVIANPDGSRAHGIELKTMVSNKANKLTMKASAMELKAKWERKNKAPVHTVVYDDTAVYNAKGPGQHDESKRKIYYRRGYGSMRVGGMHEVTGGSDELKTLINTPNRKLPQKARSTVKKKAKA